MQHHKLTNDEFIAYPVGKQMKNSMVVIKEMAEKLSQIYKPEDSLNFLVRGSSGAIIGGILLSLMPEYDINILHLKKDGESSHGTADFEINNTKAYNIIVDDFISSGETVNIIHAKFMAYNYGKNVDTLCVSSTVKLDRLHFLPNHIISHDVTTISW